MGKINTTLCFSLIYIALGCSTAIKPITTYKYTINRDLTVEPPPCGCNDSSNTQHMPPRPLLDDEIIIGLSKLSEVDKNLSKALLKEYYECVYTLDTFVQCTNKECLLKNSMLSKNINIGTGITGSLGGLLALGVGKGIATGWPVGLGVITGITAIIDNNLKSDIKIGTDAVAVANKSIKSLDAQKDKMLGWTREQNNEIATKVFQDWYDKLKIEIYNAQYIVRNNTWSITQNPN